MCWAPRGRPRSTLVGTDTAKQTFIPSEEGTSKTLRFQTIPALPSPRCAGATTTWFQRQYAGAEIHPTQVGLQHAPVLQRFQPESEATRTLFPAARPSLCRFTTR